MPRLRTRIVPRGGSALPTLTAPTPPTQGPPEPVGTTSVSLTWTHPTALASGITYTLTATDVTTGDPVTPSSGSGLGPWVLPVTDGQGIICTLTVTRTADSQAVPSLPYYASVESSGSIPGAWTKIADVDLTTATEVTWTTTGAKTVNLAGGGTISVTPNTTIGSLATGTAGVRTGRGLVADIPTGVTSTAITMRATIPVSPSIGATDDMMVSLFWDCDIDPGTLQRATVGLTTSGNTENSAPYRGVVLQNQASDVVALQSRKYTSVAQMASPAPAGWRDGTTLMQTDIRVVGSEATALMTAAPRNVDSGSATYTADIGGDASGPNAGIAPPSFSGANIFVNVYSWNGGGSPACKISLRGVKAYRRSSTRVP